VPPADLAEQYVRLVRRATAGDIRLDVERIPLARIGEAWQRQADGAGTKLVIEP
jgi:hypothetical protein